MSGSFVIIGDGIAGATAAEAVRERAPEAQITVITDEGEPLYNRILIKEFAKGKLPEDPVRIHTEAWYDDRAIELVLDTCVVDVDPTAGIVYTDGGTEFAFDKLLVATGGTPQQLAAANSDARGIDHFWTFEDARRIRRHVQEAERGVVIGAGLLGIDLAAICGAHDLPAVYLMRGNRWWRYAISLEGASIIHDAMRDMNVEMAFHSGVERFEVEDGDLVAAIDTNGNRHPCDWAGVAIGLDFNTEFLTNTPVECSWGVVVDEYMRTDHPDIYAAGDITQFYDVYLGERAQNGSWGSAKEQGRIAGINMVASQKGDVGPRGSGSSSLTPFEWVPSYSITHFDFPILSFGHPTRGDESVSRTYSATEYRQLAFSEGRLVGGVLLGDLSPQSVYKELIRQQVPVFEEADSLLAPDVSLADLTVPEQSSSD